MTSAIDALPNDLVAEAKVLRLPGNVAPWTDTGISLRRGERVTWLARGRIFLSEELDLSAGPRYALWAKIGEEPIFNGTRDTFTFEAPADGPLRLGILQGEWADRGGALATPRELYEGGGGALDVLVIRWAGDPAASLARLALDEPWAGLAEAEGKRLAAPVTPPPEWRHLWFLGETEIYRPSRVDGEPAIAIDAANDVGILQTPVDFPLAPDTRVSWRWKVDELPAREAEDTMPTHDYVSLALEFDDGRDLTWYWSSVLAPETHFTCPLPTWAPRETHLVVRAGSEGLGRWHAESRNVFEDRARAIGGESPRRIVAAWLIAVSLFRRGRARAEIADIRLVSGDRERRIL